MRDSVPSDAHTPEERAEMLQKMRALSGLFYSQAARIGVHAFIEFCGLMNECIQVCSRAHAQGIDFTTANTHTGSALPVEDHNAKYLAEKLNCIYGPELLGNEGIRNVFISRLFEGKFELVPVDPADGWRKMKEEERSSPNASCSLLECGEPPAYFRMEGAHLIGYRCVGHMDLDVLLHLANEEIKRLTPAEQEKHWKAQAVSWVCGNMRLAGRDMSKEELAALVDKMWDSRKSAE